MSGMLCAAMNFSPTYRVVTAVGQTRGCAMSPLLMVSFSIAAPIVGSCLVTLQARLERWDHDRHAED
jgi:hypothetical protein